ncbi:hypothetical protein [Hathewaya proteolytica]|nr:hypothetical protein [Hathewaya proteolytica]
MKKEILSYLEENDLDDIKEIKISKEDVYVVRMNYYFDEVEVEGAEAYADAECEEGNHDFGYYDDYFIPYLSDIAIDNVEDIIRDLSEDLNLQYQLLSFDMDMEEYQYNTFVVAFYHEGLEFDLEDYITEIL